jgi:hypothetical protein
MRGFRIKEAQAMTSRSHSIPTGIWRLNLERSKLLSPKAVTLWIVENYEDRLCWVAVETTPERSAHIVSWQGQYGGPPAECVGAGISARLTSSFDEGIRTEGEFPGIGSFVEFCTLEDGKRMICHGEVKTPNGMQSYLEDFDWVGESPHR